MLSLTRRTDYALIALSHLARNGERVVSASQIASQYQVPLPLLMNLLKACSQKGLVKSVRGAKGGYALARPADQISLAELIETIEGPFKLTQCHGTERNGDPASCQVSECCPVRSAINVLHGRLHGFFAGLSIADVVRMASAAAEKKLAPGLAVQQFAADKELQDEAAGISR